MPPDHSNNRVCTVTEIRQFSFVALKCGGSPFGEFVLTSSTCPLGHAQCLAEIAAHAAQFLKTRAALEKTNHATGLHAAESDRKETECVCPEWAVSFLKK